MSFPFRVKILSNVNLLTLMTNKVLKIVGSRSELIFLFNIKFCLNIMMIICFDWNNYEYR